MQITWNNTGVLQSGAAAAITIGGTAIAGGATTQVLFNSGGFVSSSANFTFNSATSVLTTVGAIQSTTGNMIGAGLIINRGGTNQAIILDDGVGSIRLLNGTTDNFNLLKFGGTTSAFPALQRDAAGLRVVCADGTTGTYLSGVEQTAPAAPAANGYRIFAQDNGAGKTQLMVIFGSGAAQQIAIEP